MSSGLLFGTNSIFAKIDNFTSFGLDRKLDDMLGLTPPEIKGPRLSDLTVQTSTYGAHIPRLYGTVAVMGNVIWLENGKLKETVRKKKKGGKGGGGSSEPTTTYSYSATFHLSLCEGPIAGIRRMWCGDKLLYNAGSDDLETIIASNKAAAGWKLYLGTDSQLPDSRYEANVSAANASAHRGMAYIAFYDFQLADYSNALQGAQFKVEVVGSGTDVLLPIDETPAISDTFSWLRVFGEIGDLYGVRLMDGSTAKDGGVEASFDLRDFRLGNLSPAKQTITVPVADIATSEKPSVIRSSDSRTWYQYKSTDTFITGRAHLRTDSESLNGSLIQMNSSVGFAQDIIESSKGNTGFFNSYIFLFTYNITPDRSRLDRIAYASVLDNGAIYNIGLSRSEEAGWNVCTAGDAPFEWNITGASASAVKQFNVRVYSESLGAIVSSFSGTLPAGWPIMVSGSRQEQKVVCRIVDGKVYLIGKDRVDDGKYRVAVISQEGTKTEYEFSSPNAAGEDLCTIWPNDDDQGIALTENRIIQWRRYSAGGSGVAQIIVSETQLAGVITPTDVDTSLITSTARGYRVTGGAIRGALEPLQSAFPFDVRPHGYQIQFLPRGQGSVATIPWDDLGATDGDTPKDIFQQSREMDAQLPARTTIKYLDAAREYAIGEQSSERLNTEAVNKSEHELALVLTADEAAGVAEVLNFLPWLERTDGAFTLPPIYRYLEPGDVVTVTAPTATYELRLTEIGETQDGRLECKALPSRAALYTPAATGSEGVPAIGTIGLAGESLFVPLDIPVIDETLQDAPGFVGVMTGYTDGWPGGIAVRSSDEGQTWTDLQAYTGKATIGIASTSLPSSDCTLISQRGLRVSMISGELDSVTRDQMLAGANYAAYGLDGRWEIVRFQNAALQGDGSYLISGFLRGEKGTEWASGLHAVDDYFVLLDDPDNAFIGSSVESILAPRIYRGITSGGALDDTVDVPFTYRGVNLECLSPVYAKGVRDGSSNLTGTFTRRSRLSSSWWATGVVAPVGEASESHEIDVMNGAAVVRTISVSAAIFAYSAAEQTTDFGSAQASITFRIYQLSATVGRGYPLEVTL